MNFWDDLLGRSASDASNAAARDTYTKQIAAGQNARAGFNTIGQEYTPFVNTGLAGNNALAALVANPESVRSLPGYQFAQEEGLRGLDRSAAARGMLNSGRQLKDVLRFSTGLADQTYGNQFNRLQGLTGLGLNATGARTGLEGAGLNAEYQSAYGGAGTIGQGQVAGEQAKSTALGNLINGGVYLGGAALGGGMPKFGGGAAKPATSPWVNPDQPWFNS